MSETPPGVPTPARAPRASTSFHTVSWFEGRRASRSQRHRQGGRPTAPAVGLLQVERVAVGGEVRVLRLPQLGTKRDDEVERAPHLAHRLALRLEIVPEGDRPGESSVRRRSARGRGACDRRLSPAPLGDIAVTKSIAPRISATDLPSACSWVPNCVSFVSSSGSARGRARRGTSLSPATRATSR